MFPIRDARGRAIAFGGRIIDQRRAQISQLAGDRRCSTRDASSTACTRRAASRANLEAPAGRRRLHGRRAPASGRASPTRSRRSARRPPPSTSQRIFRLVSEVVFAFDGDRAGRAAAWRALQHALPEAREGREIRFLFLPEGARSGHAGGQKRAREAFEQRLERRAAAVGVPGARAGRADRRSATPTAAPASPSARGPCSRKVPEGVYRELLTRARCRRSSGLARRPAAGDLGGPSLAGAQYAGERGLPAPSRSTRRALGASPRTLSAGRGSLVRQAIALLLQFPVDRRLDQRRRSATGLDACEEPGIDAAARAAGRPARAPAPAARCKSWSAGADRSAGEHLATAAASARRCMARRARRRPWSCEAALARLAEQAAGARGSKRSRTKIRARPRA